MKYSIFTWLALTAVNFASDEANPPSDCSSLQKPRVPGAEVVSVTATKRNNVTVARGMLLDHGVTDLDICHVDVILSHPGANDKVLVTVWLPLRHWNGRFQATGGGGFATGIFDFALAPAAKAGFVAASTNGGHDLPDPMSDGARWALNDDKSINWEELLNFGHRSLHDMVVVGKALTKAFYGSMPHHSYWSGCSTGGRQGYEMAQKYPKDFDGILAIAPAINMPDVAMAEFWPQVVMQESKTFLSKCELDYFEKAGIDACDMLDGVEDGVLSEYEACDFDPYDLVDSKIMCDDKESTITSEMADVIRKSLDGPRSPDGAALWHRFYPGTNLDWMASSVVLNGTRVGAPFPISRDWITTLADKKQGIDLSTIDYHRYVELWLKTKQEFDWLLQTSKQDLRAFHSAGGKLLSWHGVNDQVIPVGGTEQYRQRVEIEMGGEKVVNGFYRLFLAPGVGHCHGGAGPAPTDALTKLIDWVENGEAPETLDAKTVDAEGELVTRELCLWPKRSKYMGVGNWRRASSWSCVGGEYEENDYVAEELKDFLGGLKQRIMGLI